MNNQPSFFIALFAALLLLNISCGKDDKCVAGTGGAVTIAAFPKHHNLHIYSEAMPGYPDSAFVKFSPPTSFVTTSNPAEYDLVVAGEAGEDHIHLENLKCGDYFIFMTGWDTSSNERVSGGIPYSISETSGEIDLEIPVTE
ncbi:MAG: hypothetical protein ABIQ74_03510 [Chitinophagales bacterium]